MESLLVWHGWGKGKRGRYDSDGSWLEKMICLTPLEEVREMGKRF
jgi:hypothetical protein